MERCYQFSKPPRFSFLFSYMNRRSLLIVGAVINGGSAIDCHENFEQYFDLLAAMTIDPSTVLSPINLIELRVEKRIEERGRYLVKRNKLEYNCVDWQVEVPICILPRVALTNDMNRFHDIYIGPTSYEKIDLRNAWIAFAESNTNFNAKERFGGLASLVLNACGINEGLGGWVAKIDPPDEYPICYRRMKPQLHLEELDIPLEIFETCQHTVDSGCSERSMLCAGESLVCFRFAAQKCVVHAGYSTYDEYINLEQILKDSRRISYESDMIGSMHARDAREAVTDDSVEPSLGPELTGTYISRLADECSFVLMAVIHGADHVPSSASKNGFLSGYNQGMFDACQYFVGYLGMSTSEASLAMEYLYVHVIRTHKYRAYRLETYYRVLYSYIRLALQKDVRTLLDDMELDSVNDSQERLFDRFGREALTNFHAVLGVRYIGTNEFPFEFIRAQHTLPLWDFLFVNGRKGFIALFLGGIEMNFERIKVEKQQCRDEILTCTLEVLKIVQNPLSKIFHAGYPNPHKDPTGFSRHVAQVVGEYIAHATVILERQSLIALMDRLDMIVDDVMDWSDYDIVIHPVDDSLIGKITRTIHK
jgi:hypothetical protein